MASQRRSPRRSPRPTSSLGYSGIGYRTAGVHALALARRPGDPPVEATPENAVNGSYPLSRMLYVYVNKPPNQPLPTMELEFLRLVLSRLGQETVIKDGYVPLPADRAAQELAKLR